MKQEQARDIGLFFLLGFMDERGGLAAASSAIAQIKAEESSPDESLPPSQFVNICHQTWKKHRGLTPRNQSFDGPQHSWIIPKEIDIGIWARYQKDAPDEDVMTILFSMVFALSDEELAEGLKTSLGTIRYRLGKGIRQLGRVVGNQASILSQGAST
jgi:hypothetical protein